VALLISGTTPKWVPGLLLLHVVLLPFSQVLPADIQPLTALLITVALSGVGITANAYHSRVD
jgi:hypothetical protein